MDWIRIREQAGNGFKKYKYALLILALGLLLMWIPPASEKAEEELPQAVMEEDNTPRLELEQILSQIDGVGKVKVMLTEAAGAQTIYQTDDDQSDSGTWRSDTVIITDPDRAETGLVRQINPPSYLGAIVVCQGADRPSVRLAVVEAVANVTGLGTDRISVLKMK